MLKQTLYTALLFGSLIIQPAYAEATAKQQIDKNNKDEEIEVILVHGRTPDKLDVRYDVDEAFHESYSRDLIRAEQLEKESATDLKSALKGMPNVRVTDQGAFSKQLSIRGLSGDRTIYLVDGIKLANQGLTHSGGAEGNLIDLSQVDYIEVVKGSPAVIYDPSASGGVVNVHRSALVTKDHFDLSYKGGYDQGYDKFSHAVKVDGSRGSLGGYFSASKSEAEDYRVKNQQRLDEIIERSNELDERTGTEYEFTDLGYEDESWSAGLAYDLKKWGELTYDHGDYEASDITFTHGSSDSQAFHYDRYGRTSDRLVWHLDELGVLGETNFSFSSSEIEKQVERSYSSVDSLQFNVSSLYVDGNRLWRFGAEVIMDEARTNVNATMDYYALYGALEWDLGKWTLTSGLRANNWDVEKQFIIGENAELRCQLEGSSGCLDPIDDFAPTWALGMVYNLNEHNNLSLNYAKTYRQPSLYERVAYDVFWGCHNNCDVEDAHNFEAAWKFLSDEWFSSLGLFYSRFDSYLTTKTVRSVTDSIALNECIAYGLCNPATGDYNDREGDFFDTGVVFTSVEDVTNIGFEYSLKWLPHSPWKADLNISLSKLNSDSLWVQSDAQPLEFNSSVEYTFNSLSWKPWLRLRARYVTNEPEVEQYEGFDAFFVSDLYFGFSTEHFNINAGVRNLTDKVYHEPYGALDGLARSVFINLRAEL